MRFSILSSLATLAALSSSTLAVGLRQGNFRRDFQLSAEKGIEPDLVLHKGRHIPLSHVSEATNVIAQYAELPIDHGDDSVGTYKNRYWLSDKYYRDEGPVFVYDVGESAAENAAKEHLGNSSSFFAEMLSEFGGIGIVWEHRYYGDSLPFPVSADSPPEHFAYLTTKQALADIPYFAQNFSLGAHAHVDLSPAGTPWVMVGGSYAGIRSAFSRDAYPDTIYAAFASSAPVEARVDMNFYFNQVYDGMVANGYSNCTKDLKAALEYIDDELAKNSTAAAAIKQAFFGHGAEKNNNGDFTAALAGIYGFFQAYGMGGGDGSLGSLCEYLETDPTTGTPAGPRGFAPYRGRKYVAQRFMSWPTFTELVNFNYDTNCGGLNESLPLSCTLNPKASDPDTIAWNWQFCTEWGFYQSNNFGPHSLLSRYQTLEYIQYTCNRQFPEALKRGLMPKSPQTDALNNQTGGWDIRPSNVYWSGGEFDPWRTLSPLATQDNAPKVTFTTEIPKCGVKTAHDTLFGYIMPNAEHCFDFRTEFGPGRVSRAYFHKALKEWLPCFQPRAAVGDVIPGAPEKSLEE
ncbi:hypothetical protein N7532_001114 [Penicillium argentinense]|uniref:Uncharacterized protein n=1 Tax=Penicillium argentinense TaxID=1131581 RepID=A0A9W9KKY3_9EURO|nr:uncharacterized protein N7532_001114 [Penicillium argentinense]KAJ5110579.1 hypothetical protein N7532_001114 [Penicillium argentinense]